MLIFGQIDVSVNELTFRRWMPLVEMVGEMR
jgi:hypothetical protein